MGLVVSLITLLFYEVVVPESTDAAKRLVVKTSAKHVPKIQQNMFLPEVEHGILKRVFYAENPRRAARSIAIGKI